MSSIIAAVLGVVYGWPFAVGVGAILLLFVLRRVHRKYLDKQDRSQSRHRAGFFAAPKEMLG